MILQPDVKANNFQAIPKSLVCDFNAKWSGIKDMNVM